MHLLVKYKKHHKWHVFGKPSQVSGFDSVHTALHAAKIAFPDDWIDVEIDSSQGYLMKIADWIEDCDDGCLIDYDGYGDLLVGDEFMNECFSPSNRHRVPKEATHILWYNK